MNCPNCSQSNASGISVCASCGFALVTQSSPLGVQSVQESATSSSALNASLQPVASGAVPSNAISPQQTTAPNNLIQDFSTKIFSPKYLLIILVTEIVYVLLRTIPLLLLLVWLVFIVFTYITVSKIKQNPSLGATEPEKQKAIILMAFDPIIGQALYYYRLRKINIQVAQAYNKLGWKVLGLGTLLYIAVLVVQLLITGE